MKKNSKITYDTALRFYIREIPEDKALSSEGLLSFVDILKEKGYSINTVRLYYYAILKTLKDMDVDFSNIKIPEFNIDEDEITRHIYSRKEVNKLINNAKELGTKYVKPFVISTIYGLRRTEISRLKLEDINIEERTIKVKTAKKGKTIKHLIPKEILTYLKNDTGFLSDSGMTRIFNKVADKAGLNKEHAGWHSIRRALVSELLLNKVPQEIVLGFMRWKTHTMLDTYHIRNPLEDKEVFEKHPFLNMW